MWTCEGGMNVRVGEAHQGRSMCCGCCMRWVRRVMDATCDGCCMRWGLKKESSFGCEELFGCYGCCMLHAIGAACCMPLVLHAIGAAMPLVLHWSALGVGAVCTHVPVVLGRVHRKGIAREATQRSAVRGNHTRGSSSHFCSSFRALAFLRSWDHTHAQGALRAC